MYDDKPSATALLIAQSQAMLAETEPLLVDGERGGYYRAFAEEAGRGRPSKLRLKLTERVSVPGIFLHYALRKLCIEKAVRELLDTVRDRQVVVIAAGFDPLAAILHRQYPEAVFFELDHAATQQYKKAALDKAGYGSNLHFVPVDLAQSSVEHALQGTAFSRDRPALFIAEGITMYLEARQTDRFFRQLHSCCYNPESYFLFTYMAKSLLGDIRFDTATWIADVWLDLKNEKFKWGIEQSGLPEFLAERHYRLVKHFTAADLTARYLAGRKDRLARGENIALAKVVVD